MSEVTPLLPAGPVAPRLFGYLRRMDAEATTVMDTGSPTGLSDYGRHARPELQRPQNEVEWSRRLADLLTADGVIVERERRYPGGNQRRDLHLCLPNDKTMSIEVNGAWSDFWGRKSRIYRSYLLHPLVPGLDVGKSHTVPLDLVKLSRLRPPEADYVALLLIGFEATDDPMTEDVHTLISLARLDEWTAAEDSWPSPTVVGQRVRCWFWHRSADGPSP